MTNSDMPKEIWATPYPHCEWRDDERQANYIAKMNDIEGVTKYTRADQSPPLPDEVLKHAIEWAEKLVKDCKAVDCDYTHLGDEPIYIPYLDALIRAATQQPEVVTKKWLSSFSASCAEHEKDFFDAMSERFPHGIKIVKG